MHVHKSWFKAYVSELFSITWFLKCGRTRKLHVVANASLLWSKGFANNNILNNNYNASFFFSPKQANHVLDNRSVKTCNHWPSLSKWSNMASWCTDKVKTFASAFLYMLFLRPKSTMSNTHPCQQILVNHFTSTTDFTCIYYSSHSKTNPSGYL